VGRGLSTEQQEILIHLVDCEVYRGSENERGDKLTICHPKWNSLDLDHEASAEELRWYRVATASQSRSLRRLTRRGLVRKRCIRLWNDVLGLYCHKTIYSATPEAELMVKSWRTEFNR
jgi:hypothetical protein